MIRNNILDIGERLTTNSAVIVLLNDLPFQQLLHFCWRPDFAVATWMMGIFNALDRRPGLPSGFLLLPATAEKGLMNGTAFIRAQSHDMSSIDAVV